MQLRLCSPPHALGEEPEEGVGDGSQELGKEDLDDVAFVSPPPDFCSDDAWVKGAGFDVGDAVLDKIFGELSGEINIPKLGLSICG